MKRSLLLSFLMAASVAVAADANQGPAPRPRLTEALRRQVEDRSSAPATPTAPMASANGAVMLAPVKVTGSYGPLLRSLEPVSPKSQPFTWKEGGTFWSHRGRRFTAELKVQYDPVRNQTTFFSLSW